MGELLEPWKTLMRSVTGSLGGGGGGGGATAQADKPATTESSEMTDTVRTKQTPNLACMKTSPSFVDRLDDNLFFLCLKEGASKFSFPI
jgi:hypothetical protein